MSEINDEDVLKERLSGCSVRSIAQQLRCTVGEVDAALDRLTDEITNPYRVRAIGIELARLDELLKPFYVRALEGDVSAGALCIRIAERRAALLGIDAPARSFDVIQLKAAAAPAQSGTDKILAALNRLAAQPPAAQPNGGSGEDTRQ
jgi:hypothetical protein